MIIVRSPLRITLGGGGTDLPVWYKKNKNENKLRHNYFNEKKFA